MPPQTHNSKQTPLTHPRSLAASAQTAKTKSSLNRNGPSLASSSLPFLSPKGKGRRLSPSVRFAYTVRGIKLQNCRPPKPRCCKSFAQRRRKQRQASRGTKPNETAPRSMYGGSHLGTPLCVSVCFSPSAADGKSRSPATCRFRRDHAGNKWQLGAFLFLSSSFKF